MLSIFSWFGYRELSPAESLRLIRQAGFGGVTLWWDGEFDGPAYRQQAALARREGLYVENIHASFGGASDLWEDTEAGAAFAQTLLDCVEDCAEFEIPAMVIHPTYDAGRTGVPPVSEIGLRRYDAIVARAESLGVNVAMENLCGPEANARAAYLLDRIDSPRFGFCFDSGHHNARKSFAPETDLFARFGHRLMALHLHDNDGTGDQHRLPFDGNIDWPATMRQIAQSGYQGNLHLEIHRNLHYDGYLGIPPEEFLARAYERAVQLEQLRI